MIKKLIIIFLILCITTANTYGIDLIPVRPQRISIKGDKGDTGNKGDTGDNKGTRYNIMGEINILQGRRHKIGVYGKYDVRYGDAGEVGLIFTFDLDESWSVKEIDKINKKLEIINQKFDNSNMEIERIKIGENKFRTQIKH